MAATYKSQILHMFHWDLISDGMDKVAAEYRETVPDERGYDGRAFDISFWAGKDMWMDEDNFKVTVYIGSVLHFSPSGKFYMPWSTNVTEKEAEKDIAYWTAFEKVTDKFNMFGENGEGDPTDLFLTRVYDAAS